MQVRGQILQREPDGSIGDGIAGARISFESGQRGNGATSGAGGYYAVELPAGTYTVRAEADGFAAATARLIVAEAGQPQVLNLLLARGGAHDNDRPDGVQGRVFELLDYGSIGSAIEGVSILASRRVGRDLQTITDSEGRFRFLLAPGRYLLSARREEFLDVQSQVEVHDGFVVRNLFMRPARPSAISLPSVCDYTHGRTGPERTALVMVPGGVEPVRMTFQVIDGLAVVDGGIILGDADGIEAESHALERGASRLSSVDPAPDVASGVGVVRSPLLAVAGRNRLWDGAVVPFAMRNLNHTLRPRIEQAIASISNNSNIQFIPASEDFPDRIIFAYSDGPGGSGSALGRLGGDQMIWLGDFFDVGGIVHEILHALGMLHEHSRNDRDNYVEVLWDNIEDGRDHNFRKVTAGMIDIGPYDYRSVTHYSADEWGKPNPAGGNSQTLRPLDAAVLPGDLNSARSVPPYLTASDIAGLRRLYPARTSFEGGYTWGADNYATGVAFGDVDGDGADELIVTRRAPEHGRWYVMDNAMHEFLPAHTGGEDWEDAYATCCACGDVDGDGRDEVLIGIHNDRGVRFALYDDHAAGYATLVEDGSTWGSGAETTAVAIGIDAGDALIAVARKTTSHARVYIYRYDAGSHQLVPLTTFGDTWGEDNYATAVAFGDVDGDGRLEVAVARKAPEGPRWFVYNSRNEGFRLMHSGGDTWGEGNYATGVAFGDVDGDGRDELVVTRRTVGGDRWFVFDDFAAQMQLLHAGGSGWGRDNYAAACACGDVDGDGRAEIAIARKAGGNARFFICDDSLANYRTIVDGGYRWGEGNYATAIALGRANAPAGPASSLAVARFAPKNMRFLVQELTF